MKMKRFIPALALLLLFPGAALSAEKSVIIGFKQGPGIARTPRASRVRYTVQRRYKLIPAVAARIPEEEIDRLRADPAIAYVEENAIYRAAATSEVDPEYVASWQVPHIFADVAHARGELGTGIKVAVLDTGIDYTHEDLDGNYRGGYDFISVPNDDDPFDDSRYSHGTHVAGIIAAEKNGIGVVGVAPEAEIYAVKVLDGGGFGTTDSIIAGIEWAVTNGVDVINMSLTGPDSQGLQEACELARNAGVLLVAAGGNYNYQNGDTPVKYPAAYDSVIAVTGTDAFDLPGNFAPRGDALELAAPGVDIFSTAAGENYHNLSGTSQASACVAGLAALLLGSLETDLNGDQLVDSEDVRLMLQITSTDLGEPGVDDTYGAGLVSAQVTSFDFSSILNIASGDVGTADVANGLHIITIANAGLRFVKIDVYEGATRRDDLSGALRLTSYTQRNKVVWLDATGANYTLFIKAYGRSGSSAGILIEQASQ